MGSSIVNIFFNSTTGVSDYCCGTPIGTGDGSAVQCQYDQPSFTLPQASILPGYAALEDYTKTTSVPDATCSDSSSSDVALGAGLGVPLGVIALGSLLWGLYERRRAKKLRQALMENNMPTQGFIATPSTVESYARTKSSAPTELDSGRRLAELQGSH